jgi:hypothetical protein
MSGNTSNIPIIPTPVAPLIDENGQVSVPWRGWFRQIQRVLVDITGVTPVTMQTGTSTSDGSGAINVTLPTPYTLQTVSFAIDAGAAHPGAYYDKGTTGAITLTAVTGMLMEVTTVGSPAVAVPSQPFTWFATGA